MKKIAVLGSTGSIGTQTLDVVRANKDIEVKALAAGRNIKKLEEQIREFHPDLAAVWDEKDAGELRARTADLQVKIVSGMEGLIEAAVCPEAQILVTTITESLGTFLVVSAVFGIIFWATEIPVYLAFLFGGIALATAPAPSLSVVNEFRTAGPVTKTLIPMAALDDLVGALVFFLGVAFVSAHLSTAGIPVPVVLFLVFLPVLIGMVTGFITGKLLQHTRNRNSALAVMLVMLLLSAGIGFAINGMLPTPVLNFMLLGMSFSTVFSNMVTAEQLSGMMRVMNPVIGFSLVVAILNLAAPLDYHLIFGAGIYTVVYIIARAVGKYTGAYFGAAVTHAPDTVKKYLGFTLLPHSGVSLVFTGIAVSVLEGPAPECASIIQGTIAAAAVINEIIAVYMAKKGFEWAGELHKAEGGDANDPEGAAGAQQRGDLSGCHG